MREGEVPSTTSQGAIRRLVKLMSRVVSVSASLRPLPNGQDTSSLTMVSPSSTALLRRVAFACNCRVSLRQNK